MIIFEERFCAKVPGITAMFIKFDFNTDLVEELKTIPTKTYNKKTKEWEVPLSYLSEIIDKLCIYDDIKITMLKAKKDKKPKSLKVNYKIKPFNHQIEAITYGLNHDNWLLLDQMGTGKTASAMYLAQELKLQHNIKHCLIICGVNNLKHNWKKEIEKFTDESVKILGEKVLKSGKIIIGSVQERVDQLMHTINEFFVITNIETLRNDAVIKALNAGINVFDMIIFDEAHCSKDPTSLQGKHLLKVKADNKLAMTGTPLLNSPLDAYMPLKWLNIEKSTFTTFKYHYCTFAGRFNNILIGYRNLDLLKYQLSQCSLRRTKDILNLPEKTIINEILEMNSDQELFYDNIKHGIVEQVDKVKMSTANLLAMVARLRQATACPSILTTENISSAKINRACDIANEIIANNEKVVIFSTFKETVKVLAERLKDNNPLVSTGDISDTIISNNIDIFQNDDEHKIFIGTWQKCGTGITLNRACYMIFIDTPWTMGLYEQSCDRIHRIGTSKPVFIYNLQLKNTIDERVAEIVNTKGAIADYIIDDVQNAKALDNLRKYIEDLK